MWEGRGRGERGVGGGRASGAEWGHPRSQRKGIGGRCLGRDLPELGLEEGDRLEPSAAMPDTHGFESICVFDPPIVVTFWRSRGDHQVKARNPLFDESIGITPFLLLVDLLHAFHMGVLKTFTTELVWELMLCGVWLESAGILDDPFLEMNAAMIHADFQTWIYNRNKSHPGENLTHIESLTPGMFGSRNKRHLSLKAAETKSFSCFAQIS